jgi:hypothetical protein
MVVVAGIVEHLVMVRNRGEFNQSFFLTERYRFRTAAADPPRSDLHKFPLHNRLERSHEKTSLISKLILTTQKK